MKLRVIIAGSRKFFDYDLLERTIDDLFGNQEIEIVSGCAKGADELGERYANQYGLKVYKFPADWKRLGKKAGYVRNKQMSENADTLVAFWDGISKGTQMMIRIAEERGLVTHVIKFK